MLFLLLAAAASNAAALPTIFGQPLGEPIAYPECKYKVATFDPNIKLYELGDEIVCYKTITLTSIDFPANKMPSIMSIDSLFVKLIDGKVQGVETAVVGHHFAPAVISELSEKFGPPTTRSPRSIVIGGISVTEIEATWKRPGYLVEYESIDGDMEHGKFSVRSDVAVAADDERARKSANDRVGL